MIICPAIKSSPKRRVRDCKAEAPMIPTFTRIEFCNRNWHGRAFEKAIRGALLSLCTVLIIAFVTVRMDAQTARGAIVGTVSDASGAVIPHASVTITELDT